jgi:hypothetical protein
VTPRASAATSATHVNISFRFMGEGLLDKRASRICPTMVTPEC